MTQSNGSSDAPPAWLGDQAPCVYCGQEIARSSERCPHCRTSFSLAVRKASREIIGPWYYLDPRNPSGRGVTFETLVKMIEKGRIKPDSIVRGPMTHQDWLYAGETPRLAKYLGMCPHCFAEAKPEDTYCTRCQMNMNQRPAEPRPGIPADLVREPVHRAAHEMEKDLAKAVESSEESLAGEPLDVAPVVRSDPAAPAATPAVSVRAAPAPAKGPAAAAAAAVAAAAAAEAAPVPAERPSRMAIVARRGRPKFWIILVMTWATIIPFLLLVGYTGAPLWFSASPGYVRSVNRFRSAMPFSSALAVKDDAPSPTLPTLPLPPPPKPADQWMNDQLAAADKAAQAGDYEAAIKIYRAIIDKTGDTTFEARIQALRRKAADEFKAHLAKLMGYLDTAEKLSQSHQYADALARLKNIGTADREFLLALKDPSTGASRGISVEVMETKIREDQTRYLDRKRKDEQLTVDFNRAIGLRGENRLADALEALREIKRKYSQEMVRKFELDRLMEDIKKQMAARPPKPPPDTVTPSEAAAAVADLMIQKAAAEKAADFNKVVEILEGIKQNFDAKHWPEGLEDMIKQAKIKKDALNFFGLDPKKPPTKTP